MSILRNGLCECKPAVSEKSNSKHHKQRAIATAKMPAPPPSWRIVQALLLIVLLQWCLFTYLLYTQHGNEENIHHSTLSNEKIASAVSFTQQQQQQQRWDGVAATLALRAPKWFHRRFTFLLENALLNTPETWALQVFYKSDWWNEEILKRHKGMKRVLNNRRVIMTPLPKKFWTWKPKEVYMDEWIWQHMVADRVLLFSGNGILCAHSISSLDDFEGLDYVGVPWRQGEGGDGSTHSLRNRTAVLEAIPHYDNKNNAEHVVLIETMKKLNKQTPGRFFRLASINDTLKFGGTEQIMDSTTGILHENYEEYGPPLVVSGTQPQLPWDVREALLMVCPEWKVIFPSLHEPNCFGASLNPDKCAATICALQPNKTSC